MRNLSTEAIKSKRVGLGLKFRLWWEPDYYKAENVQDLVDNRHTIKFPNSDFRCFAPEYNLAFIILNNVGITRIDKEKGLFRVHDETGSANVYWGPNNTHAPTALQLLKGEGNIFFSTRSFEDTGLQEDDWAYEVFMKYWQHYDVFSVLDVQKYRRRTPEKKTLFERIRELIQQSEPCKNCLNPQTQSTQPF